MIIDGKAIARDMIEDVRGRVRSLGREPVVRAVTSHPSPATLSYLKIKGTKAAAAGMRLDVVPLSGGASEAEVEDAVTQPGADAVIIQLPLPGTLDTQALLDAIPLSRDADVLSAAAYERFLARVPGALTPPVVGAVAEILARAEVAVAGKRAVVIGNGRLVGQPAASWLAAEGAQVTALDRESFAENHEALAQADLVISGAGSPHLIKADMVREGAVLIDAGTSESDGAISGDFDPSCAARAAVFTPVPGGVGPVAVACLYRNVLQLIQIGVH